MKVIKADLPRELKELEIMVIADGHVGDSNTDIKLLKSRVKYVNDNKNVYAILNGDLANMALKNSVSGIYESTMTPEQQIDFLTELLYPIKDKILFMNDGTHERRTNKETGLSASKQLAIELGLKEKISLDGTLCFLRFGEVRRGHKETKGTGKVRKLCYTIYATHGGRSGRKISSKAQSLMDISDTINADIIIKSHSHLGMIFPSQHIQVDFPNSTYKLKDQLLINTGAYLGRGGYGEVAEYNSLSKATPVIILDGQVKRAIGKIEVEL